MRTYLKVALFIISIPALGAICAHTGDRFNCVEYIENYDGDTIRFRIPKVHPLLGERISIRLNGIDTAEINGKRPCEKEMAIKAREVVRNLLSKAKRIDLINVERGKYFRIVADVIVDGVSLSETLFKGHLGYKYKGKTKRKINWCKQLKGE